MTAVLPFSHYAQSTPSIITVTTYTTSSTILHVSTPPFILLSFLALNVDSTVFFEIYHASKQSFLYLKEFYIGELAEEDAMLVPSTNADGIRASDAFLEQLKALTKWRLSPADMILYKNQKSF
jgi:hypothetical protein